MRMWGKNSIQNNFSDPENYPSWCIMEVFRVEINKFILITSLQNLGHKSVKVHEYMPLLEEGDRYH